MTPLMIEQNVFLTYKKKIYKYIDTLFDDNIFCMFSQIEAAKAKTKVVTILGIIFDADEASMLVEHNDEVEQYTCQV